MSDASVEKGKNVSAASPCECSQIRVNLSRNYSAERTTINERAIEKESAACAISFSA